MEKEQGKKVRTREEEGRLDWKHTKKGMEEKIESAGPGQFRAKKGRWTYGGSGRRGTPRRRITEAFATAFPMRAEI